MTESRGLLAIDKLAFAYFAVTGLIAAIFGGTIGLAIAAVHALIAFGLTRLKAWRSRTGFAGFMRAGYAVLLTPPLYTELATLNRFFTERYFDQLVIGWDEVLFAGQPSMYLSELLPWVPLSEAFHLGYFAYYGIVPAALIGVYKTRGFEALHRTAFCVAGAFFFCYLTFIAFPVAGPRYEFVRIGGEIADGTFYQLVHAVLESGSSKGTAFPSSHIAASLAAVLAAGREDRRWLWLLIIPEIALAVGTVYGRFHYAIDGVVGVLYALVVFWATARIGKASATGQPVG